MYVGDRFGVDDPERPVVLVSTTVLVLKTIP